MSDSRLSHMDQTSVSFHYRDYRDNQKKIMKLDGTEFLRRFLQHVLPKGYMRVRHFGWLANASRAKQLPVIRAAIEAQDKRAGKYRHQQRTTTTPTPFEVACPCCEHSQMQINGILKPQRLEGG